VNNSNLFINNNIQSKNLKKGLMKKLNNNFKKIFLEIKNDIINPQKTLNILDKNFQFNFKTKDLKKFQKFKTVAIIGMGGSILGSKAIYHFFQNKIKKKFYFFDDLNENKIENFSRKESFSKVLFIIISKSGNTIETLSNFFSLNIIKKNCKNIILISEKKNNSVFLLSKKFNLFYIEHKSHIGGRYSVLSEVGVIPAYIMGINIKKLRSKIQEYIKKKNKVFLRESSTKLASIMKSKKFINLIFLNYSPELEKFLYWCQQLIAESLGKKNEGFLPVISTAPKDHHSLLQLYLDGPKDKLFNIFSYENKSKKKVNIHKSTSSNSFLNKKKLSRIKEAQKKALIKAFIKKEIPFREFKIKKMNEETLGELFSIFVIETIIIGKLLKINPYNQPAVEQVKVYTKKLLN
jgi:glucose-6-phosphate isomerase